MHQSGSVSLCRSAISVLVATALYSPIALASTVEYGETVDGVVLEKDIQLVYGTANNTKINPGGEQHIKEFGVSSNTEINGGYQYIEMNGTAEYSVLNDGYQIVQMGGAANQTTINNGVLQVYGAATDPRLKEGAVMRHLRWAMPEALLISVRMNIPCWIMATIAGVSQRIAYKCPLQPRMC